VSLLRDGLEQGDRTIVLAAQDKIDEVRAELGRSAEDVTLVPTDDHGRNPSRITAMLHSFQAAGDGRRSTGVNEPALVGRSAAAQTEAEFADFLFNDRSLSSWPLSLVCVYDASALDARTLRAIEQSHAVIRGRPDNPHYLPDVALSVFTTLLEPPPALSRRLTVTAGGLAGARAFTRAVAQSYGIGPARVDDLELAANEVVTNSLRHGGGRADVAIWFGDGAVICDVRDGGYIADPLVGRIAPAPGAVGGRGLWLANHLCDLVQIRSSGRGTVVRMFVER
jgi:anti-sigma regulatory factor (Ser/Thr protein kinase)